MPIRLTKLKNYEVHSIASAHGGVANANIATWVMQSALGGSHLTVALATEDYTYELVKASGRCNVHLLGEGQTDYIRKLGRRSGRDGFKLKRVPHLFDDWGIPVLTETIGYFECAVEGWLPSGDHTLASCRIERMIWLRKTQKPLTINMLREKGLIRG
jgi:flavin reductase (DIM6/NTAB) family NADH-FMN oxidoreductase RutF